MTALRLGFACSFGRLGTRAVLVALALVVALAVTAGMVEAGSADGAILLAHRFLLPLGVFVLVGAGSRGDLRRGSWGIARLGARRASVVLGQLAAIALASVALALVLTWIALGFGHGLRAGLVGDMFTSSWIAALGAVAYVAYFGLASTIGGGRGPLGLAFLLDFVLGRSGVFGVVLPRGHISNLLGFDPPLGLSQRASSVALFAMVVVFGGIVVFRARDHRARER